MLFGRGLCAGVRMLDRRGSGTVVWRMRVCWCLVGSRVRCDNRRILNEREKRRWWSATGLDDRVRVGYATHESRLEQTNLATGDAEWLGWSALLPRWAQRPGG